MDYFFDDVIVEVDCVKLVGLKGWIDLCDILFLIIDLVDVCDCDDVVLVILDDDFKN